MWVALSGHRCSSTRTEIAAGIVAASAEGPQHQGTDSQCYLDKLKKILNGECLTKKRPWLIQTNGDLWELLEKMIKAKGKKAFKATKVKGHATDKQVEQGKHKKEHKEGNDEADRLATQGIAEHGDDTIQLGTFYARRQQDLLRLTITMQKFIVDVVKTAGNLRSPHSEGKNNEVYKTVVKNAKPEIVKVATSVGYPPLPMGIRLTMLPLPRLKISEREKNKKESEKAKAERVKEVHRAQAIHIFIARTYWALGDDKAPGAAWLELFVRFTQMGGLKQEEENDKDNYAPKTKLKKHLDDFKKTFKQVVETCVEEKDALLFQPSKVAGFRLKKLAIPHHVPCIRALPCWETEPAKNVARAIVATIVNLTKSSRKDFDEDKLAITPKRQRANIPIPWMHLSPSSCALSNLVEKNHAYKGVHGESEQPAAEAERNGGGQNQRKNELLLTCNKCGWARWMGKKALYARRKWSSLECSGCKKQRSANKWQCTHNIPWYKCPTHRNQGYSGKGYQPLAEDVSPMAPSAGPKPHVEGERNQKAAKMKHGDSPTSVTRGRGAVHFDISEKNPERISNAELVRMPISELRDMLIFMGMDPLGKKFELVQRLNLFWGREAGHPWFEAHRKTSGRIQRHEEVFSKDQGRGSLQCDLSFLSTVDITGMNYGQIRTLKRQAAGEEAVSVPVRASKFQKNNEGKREHGSHVPPLAYNEKPD